MLRWIMAAAIAMLATGAAGCEQTPAEQARNGIEDLLDNVDDDIEEVNDIYRETRERMMAELEELPSPCLLRRQQPSEDPASYLDEVTPCGRERALRETVQGIDLLITMTTPATIRLGINADRIQIEQMTDAEVIEILERMRNVYSGIQLELVELWRDGLAGAIQTAERQQMQRYLTNEETRALYEERID